MASLRDRLTGGNGRAPVRNATRRRQTPRLEPLEGRALLAINFTSAIGVGATEVSLGGIADDASGDAYVTGTFQGSNVNFNPAGNSSTLSSATKIGFVAKYNPNAVLQWVQYFPADSSNPGSTSATTGAAVNGNTVYVSGTVSGTVDVGNTSTTLSSGLTSGFVVALSAATGALTSGSNSTLVFGGVGVSMTTGIALGPNGSSLFVTGDFVGTTNFDPQGTNRSLTAQSGQSDTFDLKLDANLANEFVAAVNEKGSEGTSVAVDPTSGASYVGTTGGVVAKFDSSGNLVATPSVSSGFVVVATDSAGNVYADSNASNQSILTKLDSSLNTIWQRALTATNAVGYDLRVDGNTNIYLTGQETGPVSYGAAGGPGTMILNNTDTVALNTFVVEVDSAGDPLQVIGSSASGGSGGSYGRNLAFGSSGQ
jgi:hypothetical protein